MPSTSQRGKTGFFTQAIPTTEPTTYRSESGTKQKSTVTSGFIVGWRNERLIIDIYWLSREGTDAELDMAGQLRDDRSDYLHMR